MAMEIGIDIGSSKTVIFSSSKVVLELPSIVTVDITAPIMSDGLASGISTLNIIWNVFEPIDFAASTTPPPISLIEDSTILAI